MGVFLDALSAATLLARRYCGRMKKKRIHLLLMMLATCC